VSPTKHVGKGVVCNFWFDSSRTHTEYISSRTKVQPRAATPARDEPALGYNVPFNYIHKFAGALKRICGPSMAGYDGKPSYFS
jgi:hypothetical protein